MASPTPNPVQQASQQLIQTDKKRNRHLQHQPCHHKEKETRCIVLRVVREIFRDENTSPVQDRSNMQQVGHPYT